MPLSSQRDPARSLIRDLAFLCISSILHLASRRLARVPRCRCLHWQLYDQIIILFHGSPAGSIYLQLKVQIGRCANLLVLHED